MVRVTDPAKSKAFYEALGFEAGRELPIVRNGELEATNYFFGLDGQPDVLELTYNHDGRTYDLGTGYGHIAVGVADLDGTLAELKAQGIEPERAPYQVSEGGSFLCFVRDPGRLPDRVDRARLITRVRCRARTRRRWRLCRRERGSRRTTRTPGGGRRR